jgi:hypothetical protein
MKISSPGSKVLLVLPSQSLGHVDRVPGVLVVVDKFPSENLKNLKKVCTRYL